MIMIHDFTIVAVTLSAIKVKFLGGTVANIYSKLLSILLVIVSFLFLNLNPRYIDFFKNVFVLDWVWGQMEISLFALTLLNKFELPSNMEMCFFIWRTVKAATSCCWPPDAHNYTDQNLKTSQEKAEKSESDGSLTELSISYSAANCCATVCRVPWTDKDLCEDRISEM